MSDWRTLRSWDGTDDADWANDVSDTLPTAAQRATLYSGIEGPKQIEFVVLAYLASDGFLSDVGTETFSAQVTQILDLPAGSSVLGRDEANEQLAIAQPLSAGLNFHTPYTATIGPGEFTIRLLTLSGAPGDADSYEVIWREV